MDNMNMDQPVVTDPKEDLVQHEEEVNNNQNPTELDPDNPLSDMNVKQIENLLRHAGEMVKTMESIWKGTQKEFRLTDSHMKSLYQYNETHKKDMPKNLSDEEKENWDHFNGFDNITDDEIIEIFGNDNPIIGVMTSQTIDRIKTAMGDYISWMASLKEYKQINDAYMTLIEMEEEKNIKELEENMEKEENPEAKAAMKSSLDDYYNKKYIAFIADPLSDKDIDTLVKNYNDSKKLEYYTNRTIDKLNQLKINPKFIFEIAQFEKRFLPEKYHENSNIIVLWFMQKIIFTDVYTNENCRTEINCFVIAMDRIIRNRISDEYKEKVLDNIMRFEDQFIGKLKK